jgi:two-component system, LytTR family, sensor kinase
MSGKKILIVLAIFCFLVSYFHLLVLFPRFFAKKKYGIYILSLLLCIFLIDCILTVLTFMWYNTHIAAIVPTIIGCTFCIVAALGVTSFIKFVGEWIELQEVARKIAEIQKEKIQGELNGLVTQINPHFLFNCLNNIYSLSLDKSEKTPEIVLKLSEILSYMLYECKTERVPLEREINTIKNYIDLQRIRLPNPHIIQLSINGECSNQLIAPLLLLPIVENCFKHGNLSDGENCYVKLDIEINKNVFKAGFENSKKSDYQNNKPGGIGLENVQRRLQLLYPDQHQLLISQNQNLYKIDLTVNLLHNNPIDT